MPKLRVGLVGAGMVAGHHIAAWAACPEAELIAIADPDQAAAARRAAAGLRVYASLAEMLRDVPIDAVDIASPVRTHPPLVAEAAAAGRAVLCQKPLAPTARDARQLAAALPANSRVMLHENWRWRAPYRAVKRCLRDRPAPRDFHFRVASAGLLPDAEGRRPALRRQPFLATLDKLIVFELLGHHLDVLHYLFGPVSVCRAEIARRSGFALGEDFARIELQAGASRGVLIGDFMDAAAPPFPTDVLSVGEEITVAGWSASIEGVTQSWSETDAYQQSYNDCIAHFVSCLSNHEPFETDIQHGVLLLEWIEAIYAAATAT